MAVSPDSVERLVSIMKAMGYEVGPGHTRGQVDAAFAQAFEPALKALVRVGIDDETRKKLSPESKDKLYTPEIAGELRKTINETKSSQLSMRALAAYADNSGFLSRSHDQLRDTLKNEKRFEGPLLVENNVQGVIAFFNNSERFMKDIDAVYPEFVNLSAAPAVATPKAQTVRETPKPKAPVEQPPAPAPAVSASVPPKETPPEEDLSQETSPAAKTSTGGVSIVPPSELTSGATGAGYVERTVVQRPVVHKKDVRSTATGLPIEPEAPAEKKSDSSGSSTNTDKPTPEIASEIVENALVKLGGGINKHIGEAKAKSGLGMSLLLEMNEIPALTSKPDGNFDKDSEAALQGVLKTMQRDIGLTDDEVYNYTPDVGKKIIAAIPKLKAKVDKNLSEEEKKTFGRDITLLVSSLDVLKDSGKLTGEKLYEGPPVKLTGLGAWIIQGIFDFIGARFPKAKGLMDGLLVNLTGHSFSELMPKSVHSTELAQIRKEVDHLGPQEQIKALYLKALEGAEGKTGEELKSVVMTGVDTLMHYSNPEQRQAFTQAVSSAFDEAEKQRKTATPADAAAAFAQTLKTKWDDLPAPSGPSSVPHKKPISDKDISLDPQLASLAAGIGLNPNRMIETMDKMIALGVEQNGGKEWPVFFKAGAEGSLYVMGVTKDNVVTVTPVKPEDILALNQAIKNVPGADISKSPALELLTSPRYGHIPLTEIRNRLTPERIRTFPEVEATVDRELRVWDQHVKEKAALPATEERVKRLQQERRDAYAARGVDLDNHTAISPAGLVAKNAQITEEIRGQYMALNSPVLLKDDYVGRGVVRVLFCDDFNGVRDAGGKPLSSQELYRTKHDSFKTIDVTEEYGRFTAEFNKFRDDHPKIAQQGERTLYDRYKTHLKDEGIDLAEKYPRMASIVHSPHRTRGGTNYAGLMTGSGPDDKPDIVQLFKHLRGQANGLAPANSESPGFWKNLTSIFTGAASKPNNPPDFVLEQPKVQSSSKAFEEAGGGVFEARARNRFPQAFKNDDPAVDVAMADPASTGLASTDAPSKKPAELFEENAAMAKREQEFMPEPTPLTPRVGAGVTP